MEIEKTDTINGRPEIERSRSTDKASDMLKKMRNQRADGGAEVERSFGKPGIKDSPDTLVSGEEGKTYCDEDLKMSAQIFQAEAVLENVKRLSDEDRLDDLVETELFDEKNQYSRLLKEEEDIVNLEESVYEDIKNWINKAKHSTFENGEQAYLDAVSNALSNGFEEYFSLSEYGFDKEFFYREVYLEKEHENRKGDDLRRESASELLNTVK